MIKAINSLQVKLTASFIILLILITGLTFFYTHNKTKVALKEQVREELMSISSAVAVQIDGDEFSTIGEDDYDSEAFIKIHSILNSVRDANPKILYLYTMRSVNGIPYFIVDADYGIDDGAEIMEEYEPIEELMLGFEHTSADNDFTTDEWGTVLSGYSPIYDSQGNRVGLVGVDLDSQSVIDTQNYLANTIYYIFGISFIIAAAIILLFSITIIKDIKKLNRAASKISKGEMDVTIDVSRKDEIGELADSFSRMVASLKIMMMDKKEKKKR